ncbi:MAG: DUF1648 domain-containing protein [Mogibacterium sp.]|nr:DUF1648 domain-containing protein [Mogibacterium sp.]
MKRINTASNIICAGVILAMILMLVFNWNDLPDKVPTHFTVAGVPDGYGSRSALIWEPVVALAVFLLITIAQRFPDSWNFPVKITAENKDREYMLAAIMLNAVKVITVVLFFLSMLKAMFTGFPAWPMMLCVAAILVLVSVGIVLMIKFR